MITKGLRKSWVCLILLSCIFLCSGCSLIKISQHLLIDRALEKKYNKPKGKARMSCYANKEGNQYKLHFTTVLEGKKYKAQPDSFCIEVNRHGMLPGRIVSTSVLESSSFEIPSFKKEVLLNHTICFQTDSVLRIGDELLRIIPSSYILYEGVPVIEDTLHLTVPIDFKFL